MNPLKWPKWLRYLALVALLVVMLWVFRFPILRTAGNALRVTEDTTRSEAIVVLGGSPYDRGLHGAHLFQQGRAARVVCTGGHVLANFAALDTVMYEAEVSKAFLVKNGVPDSVITTLISAKSTRDEAIELSHWCRARGVQSLTVVSNDFHLRRVKSVFEKHCPGIAIRYSEAPTDLYNPDEWWKSEAGLIMVNNEWMKRFYYFISED